MLFIDLFPPKSLIEVNSKTYQKQISDGFVHFFIINHLFQELINYPLK